jgi:hypothetical protein
MTGQRQYPDGNGDLWLSEGDYGMESDGVWTVRCPGCHSGGIPNHKVTEHPDGTITVHPSIVYADGMGNNYHGWLQRGNWRPA